MMRAHATTKGAGASSSGRTGWVLVFAVSAFAITWGTGLAVVLSTQAELVNGAHVVPHALALPVAVVNTLLFVGAYGPALAAVAVTAAESGRTGVRALLGQLLRWRVSPGWYTVALLGPNLVVLLALLLYALYRGQAPTQWLLVPGPFYLALLALGPWGEEIGWRGYALPKLQRRWSALGASLLVGLMWFVWHQWPLFTPARPPVIDVAGLATFLVYIVAISVLFAWLYNSTGGSLPIAWAAHAGLNLNVVAAQAVPFPLIAGLFALCAALVVLLAGPRTLARAQPVG
jgi:uncharacterized protein